MPFAAIVSLLTIIVFTALALSSTAADAKVLSAQDQALEDHLPHGFVNLHPLTYNGSGGFDQRHDVRVTFATRQKKLAFKIVPDRSCLSDEQFRNEIVLLEYVGDRAVCECSISYTRNTSYVGQAKFGGVHDIRAQFLEDRLLVSSASGDQQVDRYCRKTFAAVVGANEYRTDLVFAKRSPYSHDNCTVQLVFENDVKSAEIIGFQKRTYLQNPLTLRTNGDIRNTTTYNIASKKDSIKFIAIRPSDECLTNNNDDNIFNVTINGCPIPFAWTADALLVYHDQRSVGFGLRVPVASDEVDFFLNGRNGAIHLNVNVGRENVTLRAPSGRWACKFGVRGVGYHNIYYPHQDYIFLYQFTISPSYKVPQCELEIQFQETEMAISPTDTGINVIPPRPF